MPELSASNRTKIMKIMGGGLILFGFLSLRCFEALAVDIVDERKDGPKVTVAGDFAVVETADGFERDLLRERVRSGIAAARKRGVVFGRRPGTTTGHSLFLKLTAIDL